MLYLDTNIYYRSNQDKGYNLPSIGQELIFTQSKEIQHSYLSRDIKILSEYLGIKEEMGLYELFSFFFEGKVTDDFDMIETLFNGFLVDSSWCFCLKIGVTFCWFTVTERKLKKLGTLQFSEVISRYTVGKFIKRLRYSLVKSGVNLNKVKYLVWSEDDIDSLWGSYILKFDCLRTFFSKIDGLRGLDVEGVMHFLGKTLALKYQVTAENFVDCLNDSFYALKLEQKDGVLYSRTTYYKDYSTCISPIVNQSDCTYGIIIDCEGQLGGTGAIDDGCRELGGIIFCRYKNILVSLDTFSCDEKLLEDTLLQVVRNYKSLSNYFWGRINIYCYGASDERMLKSSIKDLCSRKSIKTFSNLFNYVDCKDFISNYLLCNEEVIVEGRQTLSNIAKALGVKPLFPKHKPLNDARTLFNILSQILMETGKFLY